MALNTSVIGRTTDNMDMELRHGQIMLGTRATTNTVKNTILAPLNGLTVLHISVSFIKIIFTEKAFTLGRTRENMRVTGKPIKCMAKVRSLGLTAESTLVNIVTIKRKDMGSFSGQMADAIGENGKAENNTARVHTLQALAKRDMESGEMEKE